MRTVFMGTPRFALPVLSALIDAAHEVVGVYTQPDRSAGRGKRPLSSPVKRFALDRELAVFQPASLRQQPEQDVLTSLSPDVIVVAAYGLFLPSRTLALPSLGCLNVHPSLLPRNRGPSPVATAVLNGDSVTGVTIIRLDQGMDTGPIVAQRETTIRPDENASELTDRLFEMGASLLVEVLPEWEEGRIEVRPQDDSKATTTRLLTREDGEIDWGLGAVRIARQVLAYDPWPGSFTHWRGRLLKVIESSALEATSAAPSPPGLVLSLPKGGLGIATGEGVLEVRQLQLEGRKAVSASEFARGYPDLPGSRLG